MNHNTKLRNTLFLFFILSMSASAQPTDQVEMADALHANGKIIVVVIVLAIIFTGIIALLINIDRKVKKLEKKLEEKNINS